MTTVTNSHRAREAEIAEIGARGAAEAERLADVEAGVDPAHTLIRQGVTKPISDLAHDWRRIAPAALPVDLLAPG